MNKEKQATLQAKIIERYATITDDIQNFGKAINQPLKQSFRINSLKGESENILANLREYDDTIKATNWYKNGQKKSEGWHEYNKKQGTWCAWDEQGNLLSERVYDKGEIDTR